MLCSLFQFAGAEAQSWATLPHYGLTVQFCNF